MKLVLLPHSGLRRYFIPVVVQKLTPAVFLQGLGLITAVEKFPLKELNSNHSEDEHEEDVDDEDVEDVLQRVYNAVEYSLQFGQPFNSLEWPQDPEDPQGLDSVDVLAFCPSVQIESTVSLGDVVQ